MDIKEAIHFLDEYFACETFSLRELLDKIAAFEEQVKTSKTLAKDTLEFLQVLRETVEGDVIAESPPVSLEEAREAFSYIKAELKAPRRDGNNILDAMRELIDHEPDATLRDKLLAFIDTIGRQPEEVAPRHIATQLMSPRA